MRTPSLWVPFILVNAAESLRVRGVDPGRALAAALRGGADDTEELPLDLVATVQAIWAAGGGEAIERIDRALTCVAQMCTVGVDPSKAIELLHHVSMAPGLASVARAAWAYAEDRTKDRTKEKPHPPTVADWVSLADAMLEIGVDPSELLDVIVGPPGLADVVRAAWTYAAANPSY